MPTEQEREAARAREYGRLDPELLKLIGVAASSWASLEMSINFSIWELAGVPPAIGACMTTHIFTIDGRLRCLIALLRLRQASRKLISDVNAFAEAIRGPAEFRNRMIHDPWGTRLHDKSTIRLSVTANRLLRFDYEAVDLKEIKATVDRIIDITKDYVGLDEQIRAELPTLPEIPQSTLHPIVRVPRPET